MSSYVNNIESLDDNTEYRSNYGRTKENTDTGIL